MAVSSVVRRSAVAGYFYPADPVVLSAQLATFTRGDAARVQAHAVIVPHGSYSRCGAILGATLARTVIPRQCVILGPSHTGSWMPWSLMVDGAYRTPLGDVPVNARVAQALRARCPFLEVDAWAQRGEHAIEVVLPFVQWLGPPEVTVVPIVIGSDDEAQFTQLARALAQVIRMAEEPTLIIASSDLSHHEAQAAGAAEDQRLLDAVRALDSRAVILQVRQGSRMCGYGAVACAIESAATLGATRAAVAAYSTSAQAGGDPHSVTGYAGVIIFSDGRADSKTGG